MTDTVITVITQPGLYDGMPDDVYHADPVPGGSLSSGGARALLEPGGPARFHHQRHHRRTASTKAFDLGHAVHTHVLGAGAQIVVVDARDWKTKAAQQAKADAYAAGKVPVLAADHVRVAAMGDAVKAHPLAGALLLDGVAEQSAFWTDGPTGVWCRARHDWATRDRLGRILLVDLKTCEKADDISVARSAAGHGYHQQAAWYIDSAVRVGLADDQTDVGFLFVFVEKTPPHLVHVVQLTGDDIAAGRRRNRRALQIYAECEAGGSWPGYPTDQITTIALPAWATREDIA